MVWPLMAGLLRMKSYALYRSVEFPTTSSDFEGYFDDLRSYER